MLIDIQKVIVFATFTGVENLVPCQDIFLKIIVNEAMDAMDAMNLGQIFISN